LAGRVCVLFFAYLQDALHRGDVSVSKTDGVSGRGPERDPDPCPPFLLHTVCHVEILDFLFRWSATLRYDRACPTAAVDAGNDIEGLDPGGWCEHELARPPEQLRGELLARHLRWRWTDGRSPDEQCQCV